MNRVIRVFHPGVLPAMLQVELPLLWLGLTYLAWDSGVIQSVWVAAALVCLWFARAVRGIFRATHEVFVVPLTMGVQEIEDGGEPESQ